MIKRIGHDSKVGCVLQTNRRDHFPQDRSAFNQKITNNESAWNMNGRYFDGVNDYVDAGNGASLNITNTITVSAWINYRSTDGNAHAVISKGAAFGSASNYYLVIFSNSRVFFDFWTGSVRKSIELTNGITANNWYHIVGVYDGTNHIIYRNGIVDKLNSIGSFVMDTTADNLRIGKDNTYYGNILSRNFTIYNRALSPAEISRLYLRRKPCLGA